jgi:hypothetical protein
MRMKTRFTVDSVVIQSSCSRDQEKSHMLDSAGNRDDIKDSEDQREAEVKSLARFRDMRLCLGIHTQTFEHILPHLEDITKHALHKFLTSIPLRMYLDTAQTGLFGCLRQQRCLLLGIIFIQDGGSLNDRRQVYVLQQRTGSGLDQAVSFVAGR